MNTIKVLDTPPCLQFQYRHHNSKGYLFWLLASLLSLSALAVHTKDSFAGIGLVGLALVALYAGFVMAINSTQLIISSTEIRIRQAPLPWKGQQTYTSGEFGNLFIHSQTQKNQGKPFVQYELRLRTYEGQEAILLPGSLLEHMEEVEYYKQLIEERMGHSTSQAKPQPQQQRHIAAPI